MSNSNRTEVEPVSQETPTPAYQHLAPAVPAQHAGKPGEEMVMAHVPKAFAITLSDGTRQRVAFEPGTYPIPRRLSKHYYLAANGVQIVEGIGSQAGAPKPSLEGDADPAAASKAAEEEAARILAANGGKVAWPSAQEIADAGFADLGLILEAHGIPPDQIKALSSKEFRRTKISEMQTLEAAQS